MPAESASPPPAPPSNSRLEKVEACPNCGSRLVGPFCATCGQQQRPLRLPVYRFVNDAVKEYFGIDGRLWRTLGFLLFRPGRLTREFFEGRRIRFLRPLRIYLTATLFFFFLISILDPVGRVEGSLVQMSEDIVADQQMMAGERLAEIDSSLAAVPLQIERTERLLDSLRTRTDRVQARLLSDSTGAAVDEEARETIQDELDELEDDVQDEARDLEQLRGTTQQERTKQLRWQRTQLAAYPPDSLINPADLDEISRIVVDDAETLEINSNLPDWVPRGQSFQALKAARTNAERSKALADLMRSAIRRLPTVMFLVLPIFALLLKLIYIRRDWYYSEHLIFGLHTHAFAFLVFAAVTLLFWFSGEAGWAAVTGSVLLALLPLYFYLAMKQVYGQGWIKTAIKMWVLSWSYSIVLLLGFSLTIALAAVL